MEILSYFKPGMIFLEPCNVRLFHFVLASIPTFIFKDKELWKFLFEASVMVFPLHVYDVILFSLMSSSPSFPIIRYRRTFASFCVSLYPCVYRAVKDRWCTLHFLESPLLVYLKETFNIRYLYILYRICFCLFTAARAIFQLSGGCHHYRWQGCKFWPMLGAQGLWAGRDLYRTTPTATRDLGLYGLVRKTGTYVPQWDSNPRRKDHQIISPDALTTAPQRRLELSGSEVHNELGSISWLPQGIPQLTRRLNYGPLTYQR
jgi:hypothetical protein